MTRPGSLRAVIFAALAIGLCRPAGAQQTPTAAPATTAAQNANDKTPVPAVYDHPLLQQRISLNLKDANVNQAVEALAKVAKVSLVVERSPSLALRPVTLAINEARLRDVMDMLGQLYGYRWRRKGDVFLLTIIPQKQDMEKFAQEAMKTIYDQVLTPDQRATVDAQGYISGKDLTPGQQGIIGGYLQDMMSYAMSSDFSVGRVVLDRANRKFSITSGDENEGKGEGGNGAKP